MSELYTDIQYFKETPYFKEEILTVGEVQQAVTTIARLIEHDYRGRQPLFIYLSDGGDIFAKMLDDNLKELRAEWEVSFASMQVSSTDDENSLIDPRIIRDLLPEVIVAGREIIIVDDIADRGKTLEVITAELYARDAADVQCAVLFERIREHEADYAPPKYVGFRYAGEDWVAGFGPNDGRLPRDGGRGYIGGVFVTHPKGQVPGEDIS